MPFLLAEILDFQGSAHLIGVGSLSNFIFTFFNVLTIVNNIITTIIGVKGKVNTALV